MTTPSDLIEAESREKGWSPKKKKGGGEEGEEKAVIGEISPLAHSLFQVHEEDAKGHKGGEEKKWKGGPNRCGNLAAREVGTRARPKGEILKQKERPPGKKPG